MIDYVRFYLKNQENFICIVSYDGIEKRLFCKDKLNLQRLIQKWNIYPYSYTDSYVEYNIESFEEMNLDDFNELYRICRKPSISKKINRDISIKMTTQVLSISAITLLTVATPICSILGDNKNEIELQTVTTQPIEQEISSSIVFEEPVIEIPDVIPNIESYTENIEEALSQIDESYINYISVDKKDILPITREERSSDECIINSNQYKDIFNKYSNQFGIDENLLIAMASQESSGVHSKTSQNGSALGLLQVEISIWNNQSITAYNFETNSYETITITEEKLKDVDFNIKASTMILQDYLNKYNYNIPIALQTYNIGPGNMNKVLNACSQDIGINKEDIINNPNNLEWLNYLNYANGGDKEYLNNVLSFIKNETELTVLKPDGSNKQITIKNIYNENYEVGHHV